MANKKQKKTHALRNVLILLIILVLGGAAGCGYLFYSQPLRSAGKFMENAKMLKFEKMSSQLLNRDLSVLDGTNLTEPAYQGFFEKVASMIDFELKMKSFRFNTATVQAEISFPDGSECYQLAVSEFIEEIVEKAFEGEKEDALDQKFAEYLMKNADKIGTRFSSTSVELKMVRKDGKWYVSALDPELIRVLSANFQDAAGELLDISK